MLLLLSFLSLAHLASVQPRPMEHCGPGDDGGGDVGSGVLQKKRIYICSSV